MICMTTVNEIYDQFNIPSDQRMRPVDIDIGDYTFTDLNKPDPFVWDFTNKSNPNIIFRVHEDRLSFILYKKLDDGRVDVTTWRLGKKLHKIFENSQIFD